VKKTIGAPPRG